ncbi:MAG: hypothetical protein II328_02710 [Clostridia bacterium]|nr:hypothetical protein [Clostridia bacterium]
MRRIYVKDEDGEEFDVREVEEIEETEDVGGEEELTGDEKKALKMLAGIAYKLAEIVLKNEGEKEEEEVEETEEIEDEDEEEVEAEEEVEEKEELVDTDQKACDSRRSFGSIEKKKKSSVDDSLEESVNEAWSKRYGG